MDLNKDTFSLEDEDIIDEESLKPKRAIRDGKQAYSVAKGLEERNKQRNDVNATVWKKYNGAPPFDPAQLRDTQQGWRNNFPTGFLSGIVDRVVPSPKQIVDSARYLTSAALNAPDDKDAHRKSEVFQEVTTRYIRQWDGWSDCLYSTSQENVLIGGAAWGWLDEEDPFPQFFRQNEFFLDDGVGQHAKGVPIISFKKPYLIHEAIEFIAVGKEEAGTAGWDVDAMVETINAARAKTGDESDDAREFEDLIREGNAGMSYEAGARTIDTRHLLTVEPDTKKVTQYILDANGEHKVLFQKDDRYEKIEDTLTLFTLQPGNGKFYGSKGLGKLLINTHIAHDRAWSLFMDQVYLSGLLLLKTDATKTPNVQIRVRHPFILASGDGDFEQKAKLQANVEQFLLLVGKLTQMAEVAAGAYIPDPMTVDQGGETATAKKIDYAREQQAKVAFLARFVSQLGNGISTIQRRMYRKDSSHEISKKAYQELLDAKLTPEEIEELANTPATEVAQDLSQVENQQVAAVAQAYTGNPMVDQVELMKRAISAIASPKLADALIIPDGIDPTVEAEQVRQQIIENSAITVGESVPISPRDNDEIHLKVLSEEMSKGWPVIVKKAQEGSPEVPTLLDNYNAGMVHGEAHIANWKQKNGDPAKVKQYEDMLKQAEEGVQELAKGYQEIMAQGQPEAPEGAGEQMIPPEGQDTGQPPMEPAKPIDPNSFVKVYAEAPDDIKRQIEAVWGFQPSQVGAAGNSTLTGPQANEVDEATQQPYVPQQPEIMP